MCVSFGLSAQVCYGSLSVRLFVCPVSLSLCLSLHFASQGTSVVHSPLPLSVSLSLCLSVCLCLLLCKVRLSSVIRRPARTQSPSENRRESPSKIAPRRMPGVPKSSENRCRDPLGKPCAVQERSEGVPGASSERLGASPGRPESARRVSKSAPGRQKDRQGVPENAPRRPKLTPSRVLE